MARKNLAPTIDFYQNNSKIKWIVVVVSTVISISSIFYTNVLVKQLKAREKQQVVLFAKAIEYTINEDINTNVVFVSEEIINKNNSIPTILVDYQNEVLHIRNVKIDSTQSKEKIRQQLQDEIEIRISAAA